MSDCSASPLAIRLFGPFELCLHGHAVPCLRSRKGQWLLALLSLRTGRDVERDWLAGTLWPDSPAAAALANLRSSLKEVRRALGQEARRLHSPTFRTLSLDVEDADVDVIAFDAVIARGDPLALEQAVALYRGPLLEGCVEAWAFQERQVREQAYLAALETLAGHALVDGDAATAERHLRRAVAVDPLRESAQRGLMRALAAGGNEAAALLTYRELRLLLHHELNAEPDPETRALFQQLRAEARARAAAPATGSGRPVSDRQGPGQPLTADVDLSGTSAVAPHPICEDTLTFLFTDAEGSTRLWEEHPQAMRLTFARHDALLRQAIEGQGGAIFKTVGDQFCAAFATAPAALAAALAAQRALHDPGAERTEGAALPSLRVRMALHTGAAEARADDYFGPALHRVSRLLEAGHGGQVLLSLATQELARDHLPEEVGLRDLGEHRLRDLTRPERIFQLLAPDLPADFPPLRTLDHHRHNLPAQTTALIGRDDEVAAARDLLLREGVRLVTLTGPGGSGKTRLGLQVAAELLDACADGVFFVALAPISDPGLVAATVAQTLGVREAGGRGPVESLKEYLQEKQLLLLLDNFEQVITAAPLVAELLVAAPRVKVLVTSRAVLHLRGEKEFPVPPLALPDRQRLPSAETLSQYAAVELFIQRALDVKPDFAVTNENAPAVAEICHQLDGLPLALELAAARVRLLAPQALLARLEHRLPLLTGGARDLPARQQTLRATIAWSYDLLGEGEQRLFRQLAVFVGGATLEAVETVCGGESELEVELLDSLESLVGQNLLRQQEGVDGEPRCLMLETIREFGLERLEASGETEVIRRQHARFFLALAERAEPELLGAAQGEWLERLEREHANLRAALDWAQANGEAELGLRLAGALREFWEMRGYAAEGQERLRYLLALPGAAGRTVVRAKALHCAGILTWKLGDGKAAQALLEESLAISQEWDNKAGIASATHGLGYVALKQGDWELARARFEASLALRRELGDGPGIASALQNLAGTAYHRGDYAAWRRFYQESLAVWRELGYRWGMSFSLAGLSGVACADGDYATARTLTEESLAIRREVGYKEGIAGSFNELGLLARYQRDYEAARAFYEESLARYRELGYRETCAWLLLNLGLVARYQGDYKRARSLCEQSMAVAQELGHRRLIASALRDMGCAAHLQGDHGAASALLDEILAMQQEAGDSVGLARWLEECARLLGLQGKPSRAARLFGAAEGLRDAIGVPLLPSYRPDYDRHVAAVRSALGEEAFAAASAEGRAMSPEQAVRYALQVPGDEALSPMAPTATLR